MIILDLFYSRGLKLHTSISFEALEFILYTNIRNLFELGQEIGTRNKRLRIPTEDEIERFYAQNLENENKARYVGLYLAAKKIIQHEGMDKMVEEIYCSIISKIINLNAKGEVIDDIFLEIAKNFNFKNKRIYMPWVNYAYNKGAEKIKEFLFELSKNNQVIFDYIKEREEHEALVASKSNKLSFF